MDVFTNQMTYKRFNRAFFKDFWNLCKPYWSSKQKVKAYTYLMINIICVFAGVYTSVLLNSVTKIMFDALSSFNKPILLSSSLQFLGLAFLIFLLAGYSSYYTGLLSIHWQKWLTDQNIEKWLTKHAHYRMRWLEKKIDNPDQRISEDLAAFPALTIKIFFLILQSLTSYISFSVILWNLSSHFPLDIGSLHIVFPGYLFFSATLYGLLGLWLIGLIGKKLASIEYFQQLFNADFRHKLVHIREFSEQIALYRGEVIEQRRLSDLFEKIFNNYIQGNIVRKNLQFFTIGYDILTQIVGIFLAMPLFLAKKVQYGGMMQISGAFMSVVRAFSNIVEAFSLLASWKAVVFRLTEFNQAMEEAQKISHKLVKHQHSDKKIKLSELQVLFPQGHLMSQLKDIDFQAPNRYLLTGASGSGKSTLFKVFFDLWPEARGTITQPHLENMFLLPQRCYIPHGSLKEVLTYPDVLPVSNESLKQLMMTCGLGDFLDELDTVKPWSQVLSLGQQQMVGFVRLFLRRPDVILLDESSSALDDLLEQKIYEMLEEFFPDALIISIGHKKSLLNYHRHILTLDKKDWIFNEAKIAAQTI